MTRIQNLELDIKKLKSRDNTLNCLYDDHFRSREYFEIRFLIAVKRIAVFFLNLITRNAETV